MSVSGMVGHAKHRLSSSTIEIADRPNRNKKKKIIFSHSSFSIPSNLFSSDI
jgi:hypothetical protein